MLLKAKILEEPRDRLPAGSLFTEMVAQEQKTSSPNFPSITEHCAGVNCQPRGVVGQFESEGRLTSARIHRIVTFYFRRGILPFASISLTPPP